MNFDAFLNDPMVQFGLGIMANNDPSRHWTQNVGLGGIQALQTMNRKQLTDAQIQSSMARMQELSQKIQAKNALNSYIDSLDVDQGMKSAFKQSPELLQQYQKVQMGLDMPSAQKQAYELKKAAASASRISQQVSGGEAIDPMDVPIEPADVGKIIDTKTGLPVSSVPPGITPRKMIESGLAWGSPPDQSERKSKAYTGRMEASEENLADLEPESGMDIQFIWDETVGGLPIVGNFLTSEHGQALRAVRSDWIMANVRDESGATIREDEIPMYEKMLFMQPGDGEYTARYKKRLRDQLIQGMTVKAGKLGNIRAPNNNSAKFNSEEEAVKAMGLVPLDFDMSTDVYP